MMRIEEVRPQLCVRLRSRQAEIEQGALTRILAVSDSGEVSDPQYLDGLRQAVNAAIGYGIAALEGSADRPPPVPVVLLSQARLAARNGVSLDTVLRRYFTGYTLLGDCVIEESERCGLSDGASLKRTLRLEAELFERLLSVVTDEYNREATMPRSSAQLRRARVKKLLEGEMLHSSDLDYEFDGLHVGLVAGGAGVAAAIRGIASDLGCRLLIVPEGESTVWAWLGAGTLEGDRIEQGLAKTARADRRFAMGEPAAGVSGWRQTHLQAKTAWPLALRGTAHRVRYGEVAVLASIIQDDLLSASLRDLYLSPLDVDGDKGELARTTLTAYFGADCNISAAAATLGISRQTVRTRLRSVEERLGKLLHQCSVELCLALRLEQYFKPDHPLRSYGS